MIWDWVLTSSGPSIHGCFLQWSRCVLKNPWLCWFGDTSYVHDGAVWSSPCRPHHENFGRNLDHMFVPAYFASQSLVLLWVVVFELLPRHMWIPSLVDLPLLPNSTWLRNLWICDHFKWNAFIHFVRMWRRFIAISFHWIQLQYLSINVLMDAIEKT